MCLFCILSVLSALDSCGLLGTFGTFLTTLVSSQVISNLPTTILVSHSSKDWAAIAPGVFEMLVMGVR